MNKVINRISNLQIRYITYLNSNKRLYSSENVNTTKEVQPQGFAKAYTKFEEMKYNFNKEKIQNFSALLRHSKLMSLGVPEGKIVIGKIFHVVDDDLYIDFGWKFHCVCTRPKKFESEYIQGAKVRLLVKKLEMSSKFLGYEKDLTLLEADCVLLGLIKM